VDSNGCVHILESVGELYSLLVFVHVGTDGYPSGDASLTAAFNDGVYIANQVIKCQMTMCINQFHYF
jgi:hypothetical protein